MSSAQARAAIKAEVTALAAPWPVFDVSDYQTLQEISSSLSSESVLIQYAASDDLIQSVGGYRNQGWEESGGIVLHLLVPTGFPSASSVTKGDSIREGIRGKRLTSEVVVESCSPFVDTGGVNGAVHSWTANLFYTRRTYG